MFAYGVIVWADHADSIANAYAGSGALKSDFTRTGMRTRQGLFEDGVKSVLRYIKNNHFDGPRQVSLDSTDITSPNLPSAFQDGFDLFTGSWKPRKKSASSAFLITDARPLLIRSMPMAVYFALFMICAGLTLPRTSGRPFLLYVSFLATQLTWLVSLDYSLFYYFLLWFILLLAASTFIYLNGIEYVSWPRLKPLTNIIYYDGPGFRSARHGMFLNGKEMIGKVPKFSVKGDIPMSVLSTGKKHVD
jgi:phosphatidylinositol 4-phosphatase